MNRRVEPVCSVRWMPMRGEPEHEEVRAWLRSQGATEAQLATVGCDEDYTGVAADLTLARDDKLSAADLSSRLGVDLNQVVDIFRKYGVAIADPEVPMFSDADAILVDTVTAAGMTTASPDGVALARVVATALDHVADAAVALYVQAPEHVALEAEGTLLEHAQKTADMIDLAGQLGTGMGLLLRHHLRQAIERQRVTQVGVSSRDVVRIAVGFIDLVGSTAYGESADIVELRRLVSEFEARTFEVAAEQGGRVVKFIGDEIMVAALDPVSGCRLMRALVKACCTGGLQPRGGLAFGEVLFRGGDYYGREVNLASRLVDTAIPGEVLVDASVVEAIAATGGDDAAGLSFEPSGRRLLKGFDEPVAVWSVTTAD